MKIDEKKQKALDLALKQIEKTFGKGTLVKLGDKNIEPISAISTGSFGIDKALGIGGIPRGRMIEVYGPESSGKCFSEDNYILTEEGYLTIKELFEGEYQSTLVNTTKTIYLEKDAKKLINENNDNEAVTALTYNGKKKVFRITTKKGFANEVTLNHPLRIMDKNGFIVWKMAKDISLDDYLVLSKDNFSKKKSTEIKIDMHSYIAGLFTADGTISEKKIMFSNGEKDIFDMVQNYLGINSIEFKKYENQKDRVPSIHINREVSKKLFLKLTALNFGLAKDKVIPKKYRVANEDKLKNFIMGYFDCESHIAKDSIEVVSASKQLLTEVQLTLLSFGIVSGISEKSIKKYAHNNYYRLFISGNNVDIYIKTIGTKSKVKSKQIKKAISYKKNKNDFSYDIIPHQKQNIISFVKDMQSDRDLPVEDIMYKKDNVELSQMVLKRLLKYAKDRKKGKTAEIFMEYYQDIIDRNLYFSKVKFIEDLGTKRTFDVFMPKTHSFIMNGIINHNTTLTLHIIAEAQKEGGICAFIDAEHALDVIYAKNLGVDIDNLLVSQPDFGEQALDIVEAVARSGAVDVIVIDSVAALTPKAEIEADMSANHVGLQARLMSQALRKLTAVTHKMNTTIIFINQLRMKIGTMGYGCFHYDTLVNFADGRSIPIGEVVDNKINGDVYTINEKNDKIERKPIIDWHDNGKVANSDEFVHIQTQSIDGKGRFGFTCTQNHKILTDNGWKEAGELSFKDKLISKYTKTINGTYGDFLRGILIGDSRLNIRDKNTANLKFQDNENQDYLNWKLDKLEKFLEFKELKINRGFRYDSNFSYEFAKIKRELGERNPLFMLENYSPLSLALWYMDDGYYDNNNGHSRTNISIKRFKNQNILLDKIVKTLREKTSIDGISIFYKEGNIMFTVKATNSLANIIAPYIPKSMQYKLPDKFKGRYIDFKLENLPEIITDSVEIREIREASSRQMRKKRKFDISVKDNHNYMVGGSKNGVIVSNSPETTTGGNALKFYTSVRIDVRKIATLKQGDDIIGNRVRAKIVKNKVAPPFQQALFDIMYGTGISKSGELIDYAIKYNIINQSGSWFSYGEMKLGQGREKVRELLKTDKKLALEIEKKIKIEIKGA